MKSLLILLFVAAICVGSCQAAPLNASPRKKPRAHYDVRLGPALLDALRRDNVHDFKALLDKGADPYTRDPSSSYQESVLMTASRGDSGIVKLLLNAGVDPNMPDAKGYDTPLMTAASAGNLPIAQMLVAAGANVNAQNGYRSTALLNAVHFGNTQVAQFLINKGASLTATDQQSDMTPLMEAACGGYAAIFRLLVAKGADVKFKNDMWRTPLMEAASTTSPETAEETSGKIAIIKLLLTKGVDINAHDRLGETAIMDTLVLNQSDDNAPGSDAPPANLQILKVLLDSGADMNAKDSEGQSVFLQAAHYGNTDIVKFLLAKGVDVNQQDNDGKTALMLASVNSNENTIKVLLKNGADIKLKDHNGATVLLAPMSQ